MLRLPNGLQLRAGDPVVTYVARNLEPCRGFHQFMRAVPRVLAAHPTCQVVVIGGDNVSYGSKPHDARTKLLRENPADPNRVHFLGKVPYTTYKKVLQISAVHLYLTYPFVLSWSPLETMASGTWGGMAMVGNYLAKLTDFALSRHNPFEPRFGSSSMEVVIAQMQAVSEWSETISSAMHVI